jgi:hypothetical protein
MDEPVSVPRTKPKISILISFLENRNPESQETLAPIVDVLSGMDWR